MAPRWSIHETETLYLGIDELGYNFGAIKNHEIYGPILLNRSEKACADKVQNDTRSYARKQALLQNMLEEHVALQLIAQNHAAVAQIQAIQQSLLNGFAQQEEGAQQEDVAEIQQEDVAEIQQEDVAEIQQEDVAEIQQEDVAEIQQPVAAAPIQPVAAVPVEEMRTLLIHIKQCFNQFKSKVLSRFDEFKPFLHGFQVEENLVQMEEEDLQVEGNIALDVIADQIEENFKKFEVEMGNKLDKVLVEFKKI